jgi:hypothetical protein
VVCPGIRRGLGLITALPKMEILGLASRYGETR